MLNRSAVVFSLVCLGLALGVAAGGNLGAAQSTLGAPDFDTGWFKCKKFDGFVKHGLDVSIEQMHVRLLHEHRTNQIGNLSSPAIDSSDRWFVNKGERDELFLSLCNNLDTHVPKKGRVLIWKD